MKLTTEIGDIFHMRRWENVSPDVKLSYGVGQGSREVAVFVYLGHEPMDGSKPIDLAERMRLMGWTMTNPTDVLEKP